LVELIREAGRQPVERDTLYRPIGESAPAGKTRPIAVGEGASTFAAVAAKVERGERLNAADALALFRHPHLPELGALATQVRFRKNPERAVTYVIGRNINYTNVCWVGCRFCTFYRRPGAADAYVLSREEIRRKVDELLAVGGSEVLMQGGLNPKLGIEWYEELFRDLKARYPIHLHALSPTEIHDLARHSRLSIEETLTRLRAAGLDSLPGGGAELLVEAVKERIAPHKHSPAEWLALMRTAHHLGISTTATMVYGFGETLDQRIEHLLRLRALQDETGGFTAFIAWSFEPEGTELGGQKASGYDYLRTIAVSRLVLDNFPHVQASWLTQGAKVGQIALGYGVDDFGSTVLEENVISAPGTHFLIPLEELERLIQTAGFTPRRRDTLYRPLTSTP
jgi:cyclic dehypoxanthinyl futalosine synthase